MSDVITFNVFQRYLDKDPPFYCLKLKNLNYTMQTNPKDLYSYLIQPCFNNLHIIGLKFFENVFLSVLFDYTLGVQSFAKETFANRAIREIFAFREN